MTKIWRFSLLFLATHSLFAQVSSTPASEAAAHPTSHSVAAPMSSSVRAVSIARELVAAHPNDAGAYTALAAALCRRGQETLDNTLYAEADKNVDTALQLAPNNFEAGKAQVCVELGRHEFSRARQQAMVLNKRIPDDVMVYGLLVDANSALGNYPEAENAAQWMLNLRPGNTPAFLHAADLREIFGEQQGALQLLKLVLDATPPTDAEARSRVLTQMARVNLQMGNLETAQAQAEQALTLREDNSQTMTVLANVRMQQGKPEDAVQLLRHSYQIAPRTATLYLLADAMQKAGSKDAKNTCAEFERQASAQSSQPDNANRELVFYYADHANNAAKALAIAQQEAAARHDVYTRDALAWALYKSGRYPEAQQQMNTLLKVGVRESSIFSHAGEIEKKLGNTVQAEKYFHDAAAMNPAQSQEARAALPAPSTIH